MPTIMRYGVTTDPLTLQASPATGDLTKVSMTVVVSNPTGSAVTLEGLIVDLPIGDSGTDLTSDWKDIGAVPADKWNLHKTTTSSGHVQYVFYPDSGHGVVGGEGLSFLFKGVQINRQPGTFKVVVTEGSGGCDPSSDCPEYSQLISKFPNGWGQVSFWVHPANVSQGGQVYLHWQGPAASAPNAVTYEIEYTDQETQKVVRIPGQNQPALPAKGQYPPDTGPGIVLQQSTEFTLNVSATFAGEPYKTQLQKLVTVAKPAPTIKGFSAAWEGARLKIEWAVENADRVEISEIDGEQKLSGSRYFPLSPQQPLPASFTLSARNGHLTVTSKLVQQGFQQAPGSPFDFSFGVGGTGFVSIAVSYDGARVFAVDYNNRVLVALDARTFLQVAGSPVRFDASLQSVATAPDRRIVFVVSGNGKLWLVDADQLTVKDSGVVLNNPQSVAVSADGRHVFVADSGNNKLIVLEWQGDTLKPINGSPFSVGTNPSSVAVSVRKKRVFVTNYDDSTLTVMDWKNGALSPVGSAVGVGYGPVYVTVSPDDTRVLVVLNSRAGGALVVLDAETLAPVKGSPVRGLDGPQTAAASPNGTRVFVPSGLANLVVLDESLHPIPGSPLPGGYEPYAVAVSPDGADVLVAGSVLTVLRVAAFVPAQGG